MGTVHPIYNTSASGGAVEGQTVTFRDGADQWDTSVSTGHDATYECGMDESTPIQDFFGRPVLIQSFQWDPASVTPYFQAFNPWDNYFSNKRVINRINNYNLLRCKLKVKIMINGNSFYYGRLMADYLPLYNYDNLSASTGAIKNNLTQASQRMHVCLDPTTSQGGTLTLPYFYFVNAVSIPLAEWNVLGYMTIREIQALKHANGSTTKVNISVYAWAEDVHLGVATSVPSTSLIPQGGDEYSKGPVSGMLSATAAAMGSLKKIPWFQPYAKATQSIASIGAQVATMFGFSRPAQVENVTIMRKALLGPLATTNRGDPCNKLSVDAKQELTVDPTTVGLNVEDEMAIAYIASQQSYITQFPWTIAAAANALLWNTYVTPEMFSKSAAFTYNTACATAAYPFTYWRGTMRYRFQIVASSFHRGRLLITWDPNYNATTEANIQYTKIVDLVDERDFTMDVCWGQKATFLPLSKTNSLQYGTTPLAVQLPNMNGVLSVFVLNELTSPNSAVNNDISINVYVSGTDNFEVAVPIDILKVASYAGTLVPQGGDVAGDEVNEQEEANAPVTTTAKECVGEDIVTDHTLDVYFGESIPSIRQLLKRYTKAFSNLLVGAAGTRVLTFEADFPPYRGYLANGRHLTVGSVASNIVNTTPLHWFTPCYAGRRGAMRSKYVFKGAQAGALYDVSIERGPDQNNAGNYLESAQGYDYTTFSKFAASQPGVCSQNGADYTNCNIQPILENEFPFYATTRFRNNRNLVKNIDGYGGQYHTLLISIPAANTSYDRYVSVGEDFTLFWWQGQPPVIINQTLVAV